MTRDVSRCHWVLCHLDTGPLSPLSCWHGQWQVWHIRWLGSSLTYLSPLQSAVTFSSVIWTHLFVWYLDSILRASNAILRVTEQAWRDGQKLSDINISAVCCVLRKTYFFICSSLPWLCCREWCLSWGASSNVNFWFLPWLPSCVDILGRRGHIIIFQEILHNQSHVSLKVKRKKLGSGNFYEKD